jgi:uncharacterized protein (DUF58 family)
MVNLKLNFMPHLKKLEDLSKKPWASSMLSGSYSSLFKGSGFEFNGFSPYTSDQESRMIDWTASAKSDKIMVRTYVEERDVKCFIIMDSGSNMFYSSNPKLKCEYVAELVNSLVFAIIEAGDQAGLYMTSDTKSITIPAKTGRQNYFQIMTELSNGNNYGGKRNIKQPLEKLFSSEDKGLLFIVSDFISSSEEELNMISLLKGKFEIFVIMVRDTMESYFPTNVHPVVIENYETNESIVVNIDYVREEYNELMKKDEEKLQEFFLQNDISFDKFYTDMPFEMKLYAFFERERKRKWN